jgi:phospholipid-binding lipoprotein MlaA
MRNICAIVVAACALLLSGCASTSQLSDETNDPLEPMNRTVFDFNETFDRFVELPIAGFYILWFPRPLRRGLDHFVDNLDMPVVFANDMLQGKPGRAGESAARFVLNSTIGLGGIVDVASQHGLPYRPADFGETLAGYGVGEGPFLVLPVIGPEPPRDLIGDAVDLAINPLTYVPPRWPFYVRASDSLFEHAAGSLETNARNIVLRQELAKSSLDPYATMRSVYRQIRAAQIAGGTPPDEPAMGR